MYAYFCFVLNSITAVGVFFFNIFNNICMYSSIAKIIYQSFYMANRTLRCPKLIGLSAQSRRTKENCSRPVYGGSESYVDLIDIDICIERFHTKKEYFSHNNSQLHEKILTSCANGSYATELLEIYKILEDLRAFLIKRIFSEG